MEKPVEILKSVELDFGVIELRSDNILTFDPNEKLEVYTLDILKVMITEFKTITNGTPRLYLCDNSKINSGIGSKEKEFVNKHTHEFATAFAMVENSALIRFLVHSYNHLYKPIVPVKMFKKKEDAIAWLESK